MRLRIVFAPSASPPGVGVAPSALLVVFLHGEPVVSVHLVLALLLHGFVVVDPVSSLVVAAVRDGLLLLFSHP